MNERLVEIQRKSWCSGEEKILLFLSGFEPRLFQSVARHYTDYASLVPILHVPCVKRGKAYLEYIHFQFLNYS
jgi:hypothetical protein